MSYGSLHLNHIQAERINSIELSGTTLNLNTNNSGSIIFLDPANATGIIDITLPGLPSSSDANQKTNKTYKGINYSFILKTNGSNNITITSKNLSNDTTALIYGSGVPNKTEVSASSTITLVSSFHEIGDRVSLICDGYNWFANWVIKTTNSSAITLT